MRYRNVGLRCTQTNNEWQRTMTPILEAFAGVIFWLLVWNWVFYNNKHPNNKAPTKISTRTRTSCTIYSFADHFHINKTWRYVHDEHIFSVPTAFQCPSKWVLVELLAVSFWFNMKLVFLDFLLWFRETPTSLRKSVIFIFWKSFDPSKTVWMILWLQCCQNSWIENILI